MVNTLYHKIFASMVQWLGFHPSKVEVGVRFTVVATYVRLSFFFLHCLLPLFPLFFVFLFMQGSRAEIIMRSAKDAKTMARHVTLSGSIELRLMHSTFTLLLTLYCTHLALDFREFSAI